MERKWGGQHLSSNPAWSIRNGQQQTDEYPLGSIKKEGTYLWSLRPKVRQEVALLFLRHASPGLLGSQLCHMSVI